MKKSVGFPRPGSPSSTSAPSSSKRAAARAVASATSGSTFA